MPIRDLSGQRFGKLVVSKKFKREGKYSFWFCKCDCGKSLWVRQGSLPNGNSTTCGCGKIIQKTHGLANKIPEYRVWKGMRRRCNDPKDVVYKFYGGRGIKVCKRWDDFTKFLKDMGPRPSPKHSIERKKANGDYTPSNCVWATVIQQRRNCRNSIRLTYQGKTLQIGDWADLLRLSLNTIRRRYQRGFPIERILQAGDLRADRIDRQHLK